MTENQTLAQDPDPAEPADDAGEHILTDVEFASFGLEPSVLQGLEDAGFRRCTPIQAAALPIALAGRDVEGQAQTGTGKTAAFLLAIFHRLLSEPPLPGYREGRPRALVVAPTRELAVQIHRDAGILGRHTGLRMQVVFGGTAYEQQRRDLEAGLDILIGTPGRLIDYFKQRIYTLDSIQVAVIDEADRMFDLGFIRDIRYLLRRMPPPDKRLCMLFSATLSMRVSELAYEHMESPEVVNANPDQVTVDQVTQVLYHASKEEKIPLLLGLLERIDPKRTMLFCNTRRGAERVAGYLKGNGYDCGMLTGDVPQTKRLSLLKRFTDGELPILVATDVAARGLHIPGVSHVFNYDLPQDAEDYVHRVGRTARVGATGDAVSFACEEFVFSLMAIEEFIGAPIPTEQVTDDLLVKPKPPVRDFFQRVGPRGGERRPRGGRGDGGGRSGPGRSGGRRRPGGGTGRRGT